MDDETAFRQLFDLYRDNIYTTILRITGQDWLAEEVVLDSFLKVWLKRTELPQIANFGGWLYTIASRLAINALKDITQHKERQTEMPVAELSGNLPSGESLLLVKEYQHILREAVQSLSGRQLQAWELIKEQGMKRDEAARIMQVSPETVKYHFELALKKVRSFCLTRLEGTAWVLAFLYFTIPS
ncbi:MAG: sigma-70 family RNA polymerase sigma factor [Chitinophagaceae bacterium]